MEMACAHCCGSLLTSGSLSSQSRWFCNPLPVGEKTNLAPSIDSIISSGVTYSRHPRRVEREVSSQRPIWCIWWNFALVTESPCQQALAKIAVRQP